LPPGQCSHSETECHRCVFRSRLYKTLISDCFRIGTNRYRLLCTPSRGVEPRFLLTLERLDHGGKAADHGLRRLYLLGGGRCDPCVFGSRCRLDLDGRAKHHSIPKFKVRATGVFPTLTLTDRINVPSSGGTRPRHKVRKKDSKKVRPARSMPSRGIEPRLLRE
jgi:hypothetical protein